MKTQLKMDNALKQLKNCKTPEDFEKLKQKIFKLKTQLTKELQSQKQKFEKQKQQLKRQANHQKIKLKGEIRIIKSNSEYFKKALHKPPSKWPKINSKRGK